MMAHKRQKGFTIVELLISSGIFSVILLVAISAITQMGRMFYKGITNSKTQQIARSVIEDLSKTIQYGPGEIQNPTSDISTLYVGKDFWCIGSTRYSVNLNSQLSISTQYGLAKDRMDGSVCKDDSASPTGQPLVSGSFDELLQQNMRVSKFSITPIVRDEVYNVSIGIVFGDDDLLSCLSKVDGSVIDCTDSNADTATAVCKGGYFSSQFCASTQLNTVLTRRWRSH